MTSEILAQRSTRNPKEHPLTLQRTDAPEAFGHTLGNGLGLGVAVTTVMMTPFGNSQAADATNNASIYLLSGTYTNAYDLTNQGWVGVGYATNYPTSPWTPSSINPAPGSHSGKAGYVATNNYGKGATTDPAYTATLTNEQHIYNHGTLAVSQQGTLSNNNYLYNYNGATLQNHGTFNNNYSLYNNSGANLQNHGVINNNDWLDNYGTLANDASAKLYNTGTIFNEEMGVIRNYGNITSYWFDNYGTLTNDASAKLYNAGFVFNEEVGIINNYGNISNSYGIVNDGTLTNNASANIYNTKSILNRGAGTINNNGDIGSYGLSNYGILTNNASAKLYSTYIAINWWSGLINNHGLLSNAIGRFSNYGTLANQNGGILTNAATLTNTGTLTNAGILDNQSGASLTNANGVTLTNFLGGTVSNAGTLSNYGTISNQGTLDNSTGGTFNNDTGGLVNNTGNLNINGGLLNNSGTITNDGWFESVNAGTLINNQAGGVIDNQAGRRFQNGAGTVNNDGTINNAGEVWNYGLFNVSSTGKLQGPGNFVQKDVAGAHTLVDGLLQANLIDIQGGTVTGTGTLEGNVQIGADAVLNAGHSPGTIQVTGDLNVLGTLMVELTGTAPSTLTGIDFYDVTGTAAFLTGSQIIFDDLSWLTAPGSYDFNFLSAASVIGLANAGLVFNGLGAWADASVTLMGTSLQLDITKKSPGGGGTIPEPAPWTLLLFSLGAFGASRRCSRLG